MAKIKGHLVIYFKHPKLNQLFQNKNYWEKTIREDRQPGCETYIALSDAGIAQRSLLELDKRL